MDIRNEKTAKIFIEHEGAVKVTSLVPKFTMREETAGGFLELVDHFEMGPGEKLRHIITIRTSSTTSSKANL